MDSVILFIRPGELKKLCLILDQATVSQETIHPNERPEQFMLWINNCALKLKPVDLLLFGSMVSRAVMLLQSSCGICESADIRLYHAPNDNFSLLLMRQQPMYFSLN